MQTERPQILLIGGRVIPGGVRRLAPCEPPIRRIFLLKKIKESEINKLLEIGMALEYARPSGCFQSGFLHGLQGFDDRALASSDEQWLFGYAMGLLKREAFSGKN